MSQKLLLLLAIALSFGRGMAAETDSRALLTTPQPEQFSASVGQTATLTMGSTSFLNVETYDPVVTTVSNSSSASRPASNDSNGQAPAMDVEQADFTAKASLNSEASGLQGDVNGDGKVNINDITVLINIILSVDGNDGSLIGDVDGNGVVNIMDLTKLIDIILCAPSFQLYSTILVTSTDGITLEYLLDENSKIKIEKPAFIIETDGMVVSYELGHMAQLRYGQKQIVTNMDMLKRLDVPTAGTFFFHDLKENSSTEVINADGNVIMSQRGNDNVKVSLSNLPAGEYVIKADSQTIKIVKP